MTTKAESTNSTTTWKGIDVKKFLMHLCFLLIVAGGSAYSSETHDHPENNHDNMEHADSTSDSTSDKKLVIGRMKVTLMPEYDSDAVLVIQEGKFADRTAFPSPVGFILPKNVVKLTDVCSLSPGGHHFCQLFEIRKGEDKNFLDVKLPYSDFFIDYQYKPFSVKENSERKFSFTVDTNYDILTLELHVQRPFRSDNFKITPASDETYEKDDFEVHKSVFKNVKAGDAKTVSISYFKKDARPSVDMKYSSMSSPSMFEGRTGEILLVVGALALIGITYFRRRTKS